MNKQIHYFNSICCFLSADVLTHEALTGCPVIGIWQRLLSSSSFPYLSIYEVHIAHTTPRKGRRLKDHAPEIAFAFTEFL